MIGNLLEIRPTKQVIVIRRDLHMRMGKAIAQGAHATMMWMLSDRDDKEKEDRLNRWILGGAISKVCVRVESEQELRDVISKAESAGLMVYSVTDAGRTEFHGVPTLTCCAIGPDDTEAIDRVTGHLRLL